jgi:hypothetical protein
VAKTRRGSRKPASRAKGTKKSVKRAKKSAASKPKALAAKSAKQVPPSLDLKKLRDDIGKAKEALAKRLPGADPEKAQKLTATQAKLGQWELDIDSICVGDEPCGTVMVIS